MRYDGVEEFENDSRTYKTIFDDRGVSKIRQYSTRNLTYPTQAQIGELNIIAHAWNYGDHYYKLAHDHYGDSKMWWVIGFFNQQPTETNLRFGTVVYIPHPLEKVLGFYGV
tara:strand:- start:359 stop:691 length:333 start_codon:yes stop_codon:yes gene_type:complete